MDSTFMGVLTMLALKAKKCNTVIDICNASETLKKLLRDLGIAKLFNFCEMQEESDGVSGKESNDLLTTAETVEEAHRTLAEVNLENAEKFKDVIEFSRQDVERLKQNKQ